MRAWRVPRTCGAGCARAAPYDLHAEISRLLFVFWRRSYDRGKTLAAAEKARSRGRVRKAVRCYLKVLEHDPADHVVRSKRSEEHTSELQSPCNLVCRLLLEKKKTRALRVPP